MTSSGAPAAPSNLAVANVTNGISLSWQNNSSSQTGFLIQRTQGTSTTYIPVCPSQTSYTDTGVSSSTQYCYSVEATNSYGGSGYTPQQCITFTASGPAPYAIIIGNTTPVTGSATFYGSASAGTGLRYSWLTSNGGASTAANPQLLFNSPGQYWVSLTVTDPFYRSSTASISINVQASNIGHTTLTVAGADPVILSTGNYIQSRTDLRMSGKGFPFAFNRFYNSKFSDQSGRPLGFGWTFNYNQQLLNTGSNVLVSLGDGSTWTFFQTNGAYVAEPGFYDTLTTNTDGTWSLADKAQTITRFDTNGVLTSITDKNNNSLTCFYSGGVLSGIQDAAGRLVTFITNSYGCIAGMTDPIGRSIQFQYDANTNLIAVIDANGNTSTYAYDGGHRMTDATNGLGVRYIHNEYDQTNFTVFRQCDSYNNWTYFSYDFTNRITIQTNAFGQVSVHSFDSNLLETNAIDEASNKQAFAYDGNRNRVYVKDKNGNVTQYAYDALGNVTNKTDALNGVTSIQYNWQNNPTLRVDALTNMTTFGYDSRGNLTSTTNSLGLVAVAQYDGNGQPVVLTDARGFGTTNQFDGQGNLIATIDADGVTNNYGYDAVGRRVNRIVANEFTRFAYDNNDNLLFSTNALGFVTAFSYDADNNRIIAVNPRGAGTTNVFDLKDRLVAVQGPLGSTNGTAYDALDRKTAVFDALGNCTSFAYDNVGNIIAVTNALGQVAQFTFDPNGNKTSAIDPTGHCATNFFDALNRKVATINVGVSTNLTAYDALGRIVATTNADGQVTRFNIDAINRLTNVVDATGQNTYFTYDGNGNRIRITDPNGHIWTNAFDQINRLIVQNNPDGTKATFGYDSVGNITNKINPNGDSISYGFDALNELTNIAYPFGLPVRFGYDPNGNRTNMVDGIGITAWRYDLLDRAASVTDPYGQTVSNGFDANGNRVSLTYPGGKTVTYGFDALNRMTAFTNWLNGIVAYSYDSRGNLTAVANANGTTVACGYDAANRIVVLTNAAPDSSVIAAYALTLDGVGNHLLETHQQPLFPILQSQTNSYTYSVDNRLLTLNGQAVTHNSNGDLTGLAANSYAYDFDDRLTQITLTNGTATYGYDGLGNRLSRTASGQATRFVLDRLGTLTQVLVETGTNGTPADYYVYGLGLAQRISTNGTVATYHFDIQGSTVALTDGGGNVTDSYAYDSFGVLANSDGVSPQLFHYLGRYGIMDDSTGLLYARARYFSPQLGRFFTKDSATSKDNDGQSLNRFVYALNNPLRFRDATGLVATEGNFLPIISLFQNFIVPEQIEVVISPTANSTPSLPNNILRLPMSMADELAAYQIAAQEGQLVKTRSSELPKSNAREIWEDQNGPVPDGYDVDHIIQLQHGGPDNDLSNLQLKPSGLNRSQGAKAQSLIREDPYGTKYNNVELEPDVTEPITPEPIIPGVIGIPGEPFLLEL